MRCEYSYSFSAWAKTINRPKKGIQTILTPMSNLILYDDRTVALADKKPAITASARLACYAEPRLAKGRSPTAEGLRLASRNVIKGF